MPTLKPDPITTDAAAVPAGASASPAANGGVTAAAPCTPGTRRRWIVMHGAIAGAIGYATIAVILSAASVLRGSAPFAAAELLGRVLLGGAGAGASPATAAAAIGAYSLLHLVAFLGAGTVMAAFATLTTHAPRWWHAPAIAVGFAAAHSLALPIWFGAPVRAVLPLWQVIAATSVAAALMGAYLVRERDA
jgi:hypothetical protein